MPIPENAIALATLNLDPAIPGFKIKLIHLVMFMFSHESSFMVGALLVVPCHTCVPLTCSPWVARTRGRRRGVSPRCGSAHRLPKRAPLQCLLVPLDPTCDGLHTARHGASPIEKNVLLHSQHTAALTPRAQSVREQSLGGSKDRRHALCRWRYPRGVVVCLHPWRQRGWLML